jgi:uncharacterized tellurite resistance protein B-like protein
MNETGLLDAYGTEEKEAYIGVIASIATADRVATEDELQYLNALSEAVGINPDVAEAAAKDRSDESLSKYLNALKGSDLRFSLITDIISFARSDGRYTADEEEKIKNSCRYLGITDEQVTVLEELIEKSNILITIPEEATDEGFFEKNGFSQMLKKANIPLISIVKGLLGLAAPFVLSKMVRSRSLSGSPAAGGLGGQLGGTVLGTFQAGRIGGLGSILANLNGIRGYADIGTILKKAIDKKEINS